MSPRWTISPLLFAATTAMLVCAGGAWAQSNAAGNGSGLRRVDQGYADRSAISTSLRTFGVDLRTPAGFLDLYQLPGQDGRPGQYVRQSGAISAVFPRSTYRRVEDKTLATIPPGTVYYIGTLPENLTSSSPTRSAASSTALTSVQPTLLNSQASSQAVVTQLDTRPHPAADPQTPEAAPAPTPQRTVRAETDKPGILTSESYRVTRIAQIMNRANKLP